MVFWAGLRTRVCFPPTMVSHTLVGQEFLWVEWFAVWLPHAYFRTKPFFNKLNRGTARAYWVTAFMPIVLSKIIFFDSPSRRLPMLHKNHRTPFVECFKSATLFRWHMYSLKQTMQCRRVFQQVLFEFFFDSQPKGSNSCRRFSDWSLNSFVPLPIKTQQLLQAFFRLDCFFLNRCIVPKAKECIFMLQHDLWDPKRTCCRILPHSIPSKRS